MREKRYVSILIALVFFILNCPLINAAPSECEKCHLKITPEQVKDFNRGIMSETMTCIECHGEYAKMKKDLTEIKELAIDMRKKRSRE